MMQAKRALAGETGSPTDYPVLPEGMTRGRLEALLTMMRYTWPSDWTDPSKEPVYFAMQCDIAHLLGKSDRAVRNDEAALKSPRFGFIRKNVSGNGWRRGPRTGCGRGLVFTPLIEKVPELLALKARLQADATCKKSLRLICSALKRQGKRRLLALQPQCPDDPDLIATADRMSSWPPRYAEFRTVATLAAHHAEVLEIFEVIDASTSMQYASSGTM
ncbi:MAG: helix-turn-helix domain-containing protein [Pseudomonadota bacterium]